MLSMPPPFEVTVALFGVGALLCLAGAALLIVAHYRRVALHRARLRQWAAEHRDASLDELLTPKTTTLPTITDDLFAPYPDPLIAAPDEQRG